MRILDWRSLWRIGAACAGAALLYAATAPLGIREIPEVLALLPFLYLIHGWWREVKAQKARAGLA